jgi:hypothetical protein
MLECLVLWHELDSVVLLMSGNYQWQWTASFRNGTLALRPRQLIDACHWTITWSGLKYMREYNHNQFLKNFNIITPVYPSLPSYNLSTSRMTKGSNVDIVVVWPCWPGHEVSCVEALRLVPNLTSLRFLSILIVHGIMSVELSYPSTVVLSI